MGTSRPPWPETAAPTGQGEADGLWIATCDEVARWVETVPLKPIADERPILPPD